MTKLAPVCLAAFFGFLSLVVGCAPALDTFSTWTVNMDEPLATQNPNTSIFEMDWCPALYFNKQFDGVGEPVATAATQAPTSLTTALIEVEEDDVYQFMPFFSAEEFGQPITFDIGPIGTFYEEVPLTYQVVGVRPDDIEPASINVTRRLVDGSADGETEFTINLDYTFDCGGASEVTRDGVSCPCETNKRLTLNATAGGATF